MNERPHPAWLQGLVLTRGGKKKKKGRRNNTYTERKSWNQRVWTLGWRNLRTAAQCVYYIQAQTGRVTADR